ncbi:MAG: putative lipoprotein [Sphingobacterium sp.]|nr:putative lipoprotein [Sphingobacterium sp.]
MKKIIHLSILTLLISSCNNRDGDIRQREERLAKKEQEFANKEAEYKTLLALRDSLMASKVSHNDSASRTQSWPDSIAGQWSSRLVCRSSSCSNYVIGDQRNEQWQFVADSTGLYVKTSTKNMTTQLFKGSLQDNRLRLVGVGDSVGNKRAAIQVNIDLVGTKLMRGTQTIHTKGDCQATFSVELIPNEK